jgi:hypothetical protein
MVSALLLAAGLAFSPDLPEGMPDVARWNVNYQTEVRRTAAHDVVRVGGLTLKFIQTRGVCPEELGADCAYTVQYEFRKVVVNGAMTAFVQRFVMLGANGVREEGLAWYDADRMIRNPFRGVLIYYRKGSRWVNEDTDCEELETAKDYFMMLAELHEPRPQVP